MEKKFNLQTASLEAVKKYVSSREGQNVIINFVQELRETFSTNAGYEKVCKRAERGVSRVFTKENFVKLFLKLRMYIDAMSPGHDAGHVFRDMMGAIVLFLKDPAIKAAKYLSDRVAGVIGASFHDVANASMHRYEDTKMPAGHSEIGAWIVYELMLPIFGKDLSLMVAWVIAVHMHATKPIETTWLSGGKPFVREVYSVQLFESDGKLVGFGPKIMARGADRMENNGVTLGLRHILAKGDAVEQGILGKDIWGGSTNDQYYNITKETLLAVWILPKGEEEFSVSNPTMLAHVSGYAKNNDDKNVYSVDDHLVPLLRELIHWKADQFICTRNILMDPERVNKHLALNNLEHYEELRALAVIKGFLRQVSHASPARIDAVWTEIGQSWNAQPIEVKRTWYLGFTLLQRDYADWLTHLQEQIKGEQHFLVEIFNEVLQFVI